MRKTLAIGMLAMLVIATFGCVVANVAVGEEDDNPIRNAFMQALQERFTNRTGLMEQWRDGNFSGIPNWGNESYFDRDGDGIPNGYDEDSDEDGIPDASDAHPFDYNNDGIMDMLTADDDGDGMPDPIDPQSRNGSDIADTGGLFADLGALDGNLSYITDGLGVTHIFERDEGMNGMYGNGYFLMRMPLGTGWENSTDALMEELPEAGTVLTEVDNDEDGTITEDEADAFVMARYNNVDEHRITDETASGYENYSAEAVEGYLMELENRTGMEYYDDENMSILLSPSATTLFETIVCEQPANEMEYVNLFIQDDQVANVSKLYTFMGAVSNWNRQGASVDNDDYEESEYDDFFIDLYMENNGGGAPTYIRESVPLSDYSFDNMSMTPTFSDIRADWINFVHPDTNETFASMPVPQCYANSTDNASNVGFGYWTVTGFDNGIVMFTAHYPAQFIINATDNGAGFLMYDPIITFDYDLSENPCEAVLEEDTVVIVGTEVTFNASSSHSDVDVVGNTWYLPNNTTSDEQSVNYTFDTEGTFTVALSVVDENGMTDTTFGVFYVVNASEVPEATWTGTNQTYEGEAGGNHTVIVEFDLTNSPAMLKMAPDADITNDFRDLPFVVKIYTLDGTDLYEGAWNDTQVYELAEDTTYFIEFTVEIADDGNYTAMWNVQVYDETGTILASEEQVKVVYNMTEATSLLDNTLVIALIVVAVIVVVVFAYMMMRKKKAQAMPPMGMGQGYGGEQGEFFDEMGPQ